MTGAGIRGVARSGDNLKSERKFFYANETEKEIGKEYHASRLCGAGTDAGGGHGSVPAGGAAGGEAAVSGSDIAGNTNAVTPSADTAEPKQTLDDGSTVHTFTKDGFTASFDTATGELTITGSGTLTKEFIQSTRNMGALYDYYGSTNQPNVKKIVIDGEISEIGEHAFEYFGGSTDGETTVEVKGKVTKVNDYAFAWTAHFDHVFFDSSEETEIGNHVFWQATAIRTVTFKKNVKKIGTDVFERCYDLQDIYFESPSLESCGTMINNASSTPDVHLPCEHFKVGDTVVTSENNSTLFGHSTLVIPDTWEWITDSAPTCEDAGLKHEECSGCHLTRNYAPINPLGHDWSEWTVTTHANCTREGAESRVCSRDDSHVETRPIAIAPDAHDWGEWEGDPVQVKTCKNDASHKQHRLNPDIRFAATDGNHSQYTLGSKNTLPMTIDRIDKEDEMVYYYFRKGGEVKVSGAKNYSRTLTADDFEAVSGSLKITLKADYLEGLAPGAYLLTASLKVAEEYDPIVSEPVLFTVVKPSSAPSSPATGESGNMTTLCVALMLLAAYGAVYAVKRRKLANSD